jgi:hypothetical protein
MSLVDGMYYIGFDVEIAFPVEKMALCWELAAECEESYLSHLVWGYTGRVF